MLKYIFRRLFAREVLRAINAKGRQRASEKAWKERRTKEEAERLANLRKLSDKISVADLFLRDTVKFEQMAEKGR